METWKLPLYPSRRYHFVFADISLDFEIGRSDSKAIFWRIFTGMSKIKTLALFNNWNLQKQSQKNPELMCSYFTDKGLPYNLIKESIPNSPRINSTYYGTNAVYF